MAHVDPAGRISLARPPVYERFNLSALIVRDCPALNHSFENRRAKPDTLEGE